MGERAGRLALLLAVLLVAGACSSSPRRPSAATPSTAPGATAPARRAVIDTTWIDDSTAWALLTGPASLAFTSDGGRSWVGLPAPGDVTHVRFADAQAGYAFGPALLRTTDGGRTWIPDPSPPVAALEVAGANAVRVVADPPTCSPGCTYSVARRMAGAAGWERLDVPPLEGAAVVLTVDWPRIYVTALGRPAGGAGTAHATIARSRNGGTTWDVIADPCGEGPQGELDARSVASATGGTVAVLCVPRNGSDGASVLTSADAGTTFGPRRRVARAAELVAAAPGVLGVSFVDGKTRGVLVSSDGGATWAPTLAMPAPDGPQENWSLAFRSRDSGQGSFGGTSIWTTTDGGRNWAERVVSP